LGAESEVCPQAREGVDPHAKIDDDQVRGLLLSGPRVATLFGQRESRGWLKPCTVTGAMERLFSS
jgi:hypothetical protein